MSNNVSGYYRIFRFLKQKAQEIYNPDNLQEAKTFEDVAIAVLTSFNPRQLATLASGMGIDNVHQFCGLLEFGAAVSRIDYHLREMDGDWT